MNTPKQQLDPPDAAGWARRIKRGELTIETICGYLELEIPAGLQGVRSEPVSRIAASLKTVRQGSVYVTSVADEAARERVRQAFERGALCAITNRPVADAAGSPLPCILCERPLDTSARVLRLLRENSSARVVAITGSIGKTTVKEMIRLVAEASFKTEYSKKNQNGYGQVARRIQQLDPKTEVFVQETGLSKPGSIARCATALRPDGFVITNIGLNHVGYFGGDQQGILREKLALDARAAPGAVGFVNWDDPLLRGAAYQHRIVRYALDDAEADYRAEDIVEHDGRIDFCIAVGATGERVPVRLNLIGRHNVSNALCAFAVGTWLGVPRAKIVRALASFAPTGVRQNLVWLAGQHVYLDCYNASEGAAQSTAAAMASISVPDGAKRVLVFADIDDKLGGRTEEVHRRLGQTLAARRDGVDLLLCFGEHARWTAEEAVAHGLAARSTCSRAQLEAWVRELVAPGDLLAFKGGQQMMLAKSVDNLFGTPYFTLDRDVIDEATDALVLHDRLEYRVLADYGVEVRGRIKSARGKSWSKALRRMLAPGADAAIVLPTEVDGSPVRVVGKDAFAQSAAARIELPEGLRTIDSMAFHRALKLREVRLPSTLEYIGPRAFGSCISLARVDVPEGVTTICERAFSNCLGLVEVRLPASVRTLGPELFYRSPRVRVVCPAGSAALEYCREHYPTRIA